MEKSSNGLPDVASNTEAEKDPLADILNAFPDFAKGYALAIIDWRLKNGPRSIPPITLIEGKPRWINRETRRKLARGKIK